MTSFSGRGLASEMLAASLESSLESTLNSGMAPQEPTDCGKFR
jgi:hypothetical protein